VIYLICAGVTIGGETHWIPVDTEDSEPAARSRASGRFIASPYTAIIEWHGDAPEMHERLKPRDLNGTEHRIVYTEQLLTTAV